MGWGLNKPKVRDQWAEWTRFTQMARGENPAGLEDMVGRPFRTPVYPPGTSRGDDLLGQSNNGQGDEPLALEPVPTPEQQYALAMLAHLAEMGVLSRLEFDVLQARVRSMAMLP